MKYSPWHESRCLCHHLFSSYPGTRVLRRPFHPFLRLVYKIFDVWHTSVRLLLVFKIYSSSLSDDTLSLLTVVTVSWNYKDCLTLQRSLCTYSNIPPPSIQSEPYSFFLVSPSIYIIYINIINIIIYIIIII